MITQQQQHDHPQRENDYPQQLYFPAPRGFAHAHGRRVRTDVRVDDDISIKVNFSKVNTLQTLGAGLGWRRLALVPSFQNYLQTKYDPAQTLNPSRLCSLEN
jgi:hypothetical protein